MNIPEIRRVIGLIEAAPVFDMNKGHRCIAGLALGGSYGYANDIERVFEIPQRHAQEMYTGWLDSVFFPRDGQPENQRVPGKAWAIAMLNKYIESETVDWLGTEPVLDSELQQVENE